MMRRLFFACVLAGAGIARADSEVVDGITWTYTVSDGTASVGSGSYESPAIPRLTTGAITIPSALGGYPVTSIGEWAFGNCSGLTSVTIPSSVTNIGGSAFQCCIGLTSMTIPEGVTSIGGGAFYGCSGLTSVTMPSSVRQIDSGAFSCCSGLMSFSVDEANMSYKSVSGLLLTKDGKTLIGGVNGVVTIPSSVTSIGASAFGGCSMLTSVTIPSSVTSIEGSAFWGCSGLTSVAIPSSVTSIGRFAFGDCIGLTSVTIPSSVTSIGRGAFSGCGGLEHVQVDFDDADRVRKMLEGSGLNCSGIEFVEDCTGYAVKFLPGEGSSTMPRTVYKNDIVNALPPNAFAPPSGKRFAGWQCSNGKRYDDGMLIFNLAEPGKTVTMTAVWE